MAEQNIWVNALIGAVIGVVLSWIPLSPVLGGGVAGYLQKDEGLKVGALAGAIAAIPFILIVFFIFGFLSIGAFSVGETGGGLLFGFLFWIIVLFGVAYSIVLSAIGGWIGVYIANEA
ncbi:MULTISPECIES: DUF5518 domain-containing protein [unclassified Haladaptatus]|uniref:DUF5518 domain-containing protein n=1 Tax=unclassified Haladaptatus TaxID=2622732 RepID=UPI0023E896ED|nr:MULTISPECIES: DUF5518 domain-containing protein [unclassified Haladaptatus]